MCIRDRLNPAIGLSFTPTKDLSVYGSYNEGMRAPTSMELGCANPNVPCKLPNAMAGDPPLDEVVSKTFELGARGNLTSDVKWSAAVYHTDNPVSYTHLDVYKRQLLGTSRSTLHGYALQNAITWCDDESNLNVDYERNFVRHKVVPVLQERNPSIQPVIARVATHLAEANTLLDNLAEIDASQVLSQNSLCLISLEKLTLARAKNLLRWWLANNQISMPNTEYLSEMLHQLLNAKPDANVDMPLRHNEMLKSNQPPISLRRYLQRAYLVSTQKSKPIDLLWHGEPFLTLPNGGGLEFRHVIGAGLALSLIHI